MEQQEFSKGLVNLQADLQRFAFKLTRNKDNAYDLLQETSLKALSNAKMYREDTNLRGWLFSIMHNLFVNGYRKMSHYRSFVVSMDADFTIANYVKENVSSKSDAQDLTEIQLRIKQLPDSSRIPFQLFIAGFKYREIADRLQLPLGTIKSRLFNTRNHLQKELGDFI